MVCVCVKEGERGGGQEVDKTDIQREGYRFYLYLFYSTRPKITEILCDEVTKRSFLG